LHEIGTNGVLARSIAGPVTLLDLLGLGVAVAIPAILWLRWRAQVAKAAAAAETGDEVFGSDGAMHSILGLDDHSSAKVVEGQVPSASTPAVPAGILTVHGTSRQPDLLLDEPHEQPALAGKPWESMDIFLKQPGATVGDEPKPSLTAPQPGPLDIFLQPSPPPPPAVLSEEPEPVTAENAAAVEEPAPHITASVPNDAADVFVRQMQPISNEEPHGSEAPAENASASHSVDWLAGLYQRPQAPVPGVVEESKPPESASQPVSWQDNVVQQQPLPVPAAATEGSNTMDNSNVINVAPETAHASQPSAPAGGFREQLAALNASWQRIETSGKEVEEWFHRQQDRVLAHIERHATGGVDDAAELSRDYLEQRIQSVDAEWFRIHKAVRDMNRWLDSTAPPGQLEQLASMH
jgi:hypothetical protein